MNSNQTSANNLQSKHREESMAWMEYADGDAAVAHHLFEGFYHPKKLEIIC